MDATVRDATGATEFLTEAAALAHRLLQHGRSIFAVQYDGVAFGSWTVSAGTPKRRVVVTWAGRDGRLSARAASFSDSRTQPQWSSVLEQTLDHRTPGALLRLAERVILSESDAPAV